MHLKMSSKKWWPFCLGLNVLNAPLISMQRHVAGKTCQAQDFESIQVYHLDYREEMPGTLRKTFSDHFSCEAHGISIQSSLKITYQMNLL